MQTQTLEQLYEARRTTVDPKKYDELSAAIVAAGKERDLAEARRLAAEGERQAQEAARKAELCRQHKAQLDRVYQEAAGVDERIFEAAAALHLVMNERFALADQAESLEEQVRQEAAEMRLPFVPKAPALVGGSLLFAGRHQMLKTWLQRLEDYSARLGRLPTLAEMAGHGLQGGTETADLPTKF